jgi:voltage-gated potassium channel
MLREEVDRLFSWGEHHRRLVARVTLALGLTLAVDAIGSLLVWRFERGVKGGDIHGFGDAVFFTTVQLLTVSSQMKNPLTAAGRCTDVGLEIWAVFVVTAIAGSFAAFFNAASNASSG